MMKLLELPRLRGTDSIRERVSAVRPRRVEALTEAERYLRRALIDSALWLDVPAGRPHLTALEDRRGGAEAIDRRRRALYRAPHEWLPIKQVNLPDQPEPVALDVDSDGNWVCRPTSRLAISAAA